MIVQGMITREIMQDIVDLSDKKQEIFGDYVKLMHQNVDKVVKSTGKNLRNKSQALGKSHIISQKHHCQSSKSLNKVAVQA